MLKLIVGSVWSKIHGDLDKSVKDALDQELSFEIENSRFIAPFMWEGWDGRVKLFQRREQAFRSGLARRAHALLQELEIPHEVELRLPQYEFSHVFPFHGELRDYQQASLDTLYKTRRGILWSVPRSGKTVIAAALISKLGWSHNLFICESLDIAYQTKRLFERALGASVGVIGDGRVETAPITVATIQTLLQAYDIKNDETVEQVEARLEAKEPVRRYVESAQLVICDEAHHCAAQSYQQVSMNFTAAGRIYGLSGTPWRMDQADLLMEAVCGPIVYQVSYGDLIQRGFLVPPVICFQHVSPQKYPSNVHYQTIYKDYIVRNHERNAAIVDFVQRMEGKGMSTLVLVDQINHGEALRKVLRAPFLQGKVESAERIRTLDELRSKKILTVVTTLGDEGLDIPSLDGEVIASGGLSSARALQRLRAMTAHPGKKRCYVLDFFDNAKYLSRHSKARLQLYHSIPDFTVIEQRLSGS